MNPFKNYQFINAEEIIKANIRPNNIAEDSSSLLNALQPLAYIASSGSQKATNLHRNVIQKLTPKRHTLQLLELLGYELSKQGDYMYRITSSNDELEFRENVANEFQRFNNDLKKIKAGNLNGFEDYIEQVSSRPQSRNKNPDDDYYVPERSRERKPSHKIFRPSSRSPSPLPLPPSPPPPPPSSSSSRLPDYHTVQRNNEKTAEIIRSFKEIIQPKHNGRVVHSFIRRKLLLQLFQQKFPTALEFGDQEVDRDIDRRIDNLRRADRQQNNTGSTDEVYYECLLRADFEHDKALEILRYNRPNLQPPLETEYSQGPTTTTIDSALQSVRQQWDLLTQNANENEDEQILVHAGDEWKNTVHVIAAIIQLREQYENQEKDPRIINRLYRLIFNELSEIIGPQSILKIEIIANSICEAPCDSIKRLNMIDIRDTVLSCSDTGIPENFQRTVMNFLSVECSLCSDTYPSSHMEEMFLCNHRCCLDCIKGYYRVAITHIKDTESLKKLTCFQEELEIAEDVKMNFFNWLGTKLNQWFTDERRILDLYHENIYIATRDSKDKKCGNPRCTGFFYNDNNRVARAQCPHCQFRQCQQCCRKWNDNHKELTCDKYAEWLLENDPDDPLVQLVKYLNTAGMVCPKQECGAVYEYQAGGCEHFTCPKCKTEFCRICSAFFYNPKHNTICPRPNCTLKNTVHAHCFFNCFREIRDASVEEITQLLTANKVNVTEELRLKPQATGPGCPVEGCQKAASVTYENRFCDGCYKQFLCLFIWRNQIEPWTLYTEGNLRQKLANVSVTAPANAQKPALIALAKQHLTQYLGKPKKIERRNLE